MFRKITERLRLKNGVKPSCAVLPSQGQGLALDFSCQRLPAVSAQRLAAAHGCPRSGRPAGPPRTPETPFLTGLRMTTTAKQRTSRHAFRAQVLYQDHLVGADKPHLPVTPAGSYIQHTLLVQLKNPLGLPEPVPHPPALTATRPGRYCCPPSAVTRGVPGAVSRAACAQNLPSHRALPARAWLSSANTTSRHEESSHSSACKKSQAHPIATPASMLLEHNTHWARSQLKPSQRQTPPTARTHGGPGHRHLGRWPLTR